MAQTLRTKGLRDFIRAADAADKKTKKLVRERLRDAAEPILRDGRSKLSKYDERSASRLGISVRRTGVVAVEQRLRRTTGKHPEYSRLQMVKALEPALEENQAGVERWFLDAVDDVADILTRRRF